MATGEVRSAMGSAEPTTSSGEVIEKSAVQKG
jgi:hypothetical protein